MQTHAALFYKLFALRTVLLCCRYWGEVQLLSSGVAKDGDNTATTLGTPVEALLQKLLMGSDELLGEFLDFMVAGFSWKRVGPLIMDLFCIIDKTDRREPGLLGHRTLALPTRPQFTLPYLPLFISPLTPSLRSLTSLHYSPSLHAPSLRPPTSLHTLLPAGSGPPSPSHSL